MSAVPFVIKENRAEYWQQEELLGEVTFPPLRPGVVNIDHVFVDPVLRGKGVADQLLEQVCGELRRTRRRAVVTCSYARRWFERHPEQGEALKR